jgi:hypothetical protein
LLGAALIGKPDFGFQRRKLAISLAIYAKSSKWTSTETRSNLTSMVKSIKNTYQRTDKPAIYQFVDIEQPRFDGVSRKRVSDDPKRIKLGLADFEDGKVNCTRETKFRYCEL